MKKTPAKQLDREIRASLSKKNVQEDPVTAARRRARSVRTMMAELTGDDDWYGTDLDAVAGWLGSEPTTEAICERLMADSVEPHHCGGPSKTVEEE